jgi:hypothetical protein
MSDQVSSVLIEEVLPDGTRVATTRVDVQDRTPLWKRVVNTITGTPSEAAIDDQALEAYIDAKGSSPVGYASNAELDATAAAIPGTLLQMDNYYGGLETEIPYVK